MIVILSNLTKARKLVDKTCYHLINTTLFIAVLIKKYCRYVLIYIIVIKAMAIRSKPFRI